jgi:hypothetical protein
MKVCEYFGTEEKRGEEEETIRPLMKLFEREKKDPNIFQRFFSNFEDFCLNKTHKLS